MSSEGPRLLTFRLLSKRSRPWSNNNEKVHGSHVGRAGRRVRAAAKEKRPLNRLK